MNIILHLHPQADVYVLKRSIGAKLTGKPKPVGWRTGDIFSTWKNGFRVS